MKKFLYWTVALLVVVLTVFIYWKYVYTYGEGYRAGMLQKFSYKGTIFKTYEGELILSSIKSNQDVSLASEKFFFSVEDKAVAHRFFNWKDLWWFCTTKKKTEDCPGKVIQDTWSTV